MRPPTVRSGWRTRMQPASPSAADRREPAIAPPSRSLSGLIWSCLRHRPLVLGELPFSSLLVSLCGLALSLVVIMVFNRYLLAHGTTATLITLTARGNPGGGDGTCLRPGARDAGLRDLYTRPAERLWKTITPIC